HQPLPSFPTRRSSDLTCLRVRPRRFLDSRTRRPRERRKSPFSDVPVGGKVGPLDGVVVGGAIMQKHCTACIIIQGRRCLSILICIIVPTTSPPSQEGTRYETR